MKTHDERLLMHTAGLNPRPAVSSPAASQRGVRRDLTRALIAAAAGAVLLIDLLLGLNALRAAGLVGVEPSGGTVFRTMVHGLQQNLIWLIVTGVGLLGVAISGLMMFGSQQAIVMFFRLGAGIAGILIVVPAILA